MEAFRVGNRRILLVDRADSRYERLSIQERALLQRAIATLLGEPDRLYLYAGRPSAGGGPQKWLLLMQPLLIEMSESGNDILISRILITRDPLEPL